MVFSPWRMQAHPNGILPTPAGFRNIPLIDLQPGYQAFHPAMLSSSTLLTAWGSRFPDCVEARCRDLP